MSWRERAPVASPRLAERAASAPNNGAAEGARGTKALLSLAAEARPVRSIRRRGDDVDGDNGLKGSRGGGVAPRRADGRSETARGSVKLMGSLLRLGGDTSADGYP